MAQAMTVNEKRRKYQAPPDDSSALLINEEPLQVLPSLAAALGLEEALIIQQVHYWLRKSEHLADGHRWVWNTHEDWHKQFPFLGVDALQKLFTRLERPFVPGKRDHRVARGPLLIASSAYNKLKFDRTKWYRLDYAELNRFCALACPSREMAECSRELAAPFREMADSESATSRDLLPETTEREEDAKHGLEARATQIETPPASSREFRLQQAKADEAEAYTYPAASRPPADPLIDRAEPPPVYEARQVPPPPNTQRPAAPEVTDTNLRAAANDAVFAYSDLDGHGAWINRLLSTAERLRDDRGVPEGVLCDLLRQAGPRGRAVWQEHDAGRKGDRPQFVNRLEHAFADLVAEWRKTQERERKAAARAAKEAAAPPPASTEDSSNSVAAYYAEVADLGPAHPDWLKLTRTERDVLKQRWRKLHPEAFQARLEASAGAGMVA